ncbi:MAG: sugar phosphate isomerase/epimerase family protein [Candidatus Eremiobacterota bacterium]
MKTGVLNHPGHKLIDEIKWISENGFDFIDLTIEPPGAYEFDVKEIKSLLDHFNLEAVGHTNPFLPFIFPLKSIRKVCMDEFKIYIDIFSRLGIKLMNIHPSYNAPQMSDEDKIKENIEFFRQINELCKTVNMTLMVENFMKPFDSPAVFERICSEIPDIKVHLDVGHSNICQEKNLAKAFFSKLSDKIVHLHFSDNKGIHDDHLPLGCGNIDWKNIIKIIKTSGYDRTITLEIFSPHRDYLLLSRDKLKKWWQ